ncbi:GNAT family N-acetyltransferase [Pseudoxanthomonas sp. UTMC 1351]|uniref:GNAT family N-acetyltransferase n=1 Tax=Pseudoxanthomonas sp. UTMC 1351 TaxID=2695853 RepID=UPI0034CE9621
MTDLNIQHDTTAQRFLVRIEGHEAELVYRQGGGQMEIVRTSVPEAIGGRGIAAQLVKTALDFARAEKWQVKPTCSYAADYVRRHPEYADMVD